MLSLSGIHAVILLIVAGCVRQEQAKRLGRSNPESLTDAMAWAHDNFAMNVCCVKQQEACKCVTSLRCV